ncbi:MAG: fused signal recognition particle receptor [Moritella sp.]|jgi:fused signal recognition particle receptor
MAKKGMKNWFGFGKKEAKETLENEATEAQGNGSIAAENVATDIQVLNTDIDSGTAIDTDSVNADVASAPSDVAETTSAIDSEVADEKEAESEIISEANTDSNTESAESASGNDALTEAPKWYQFGKKKQLKQITDQTQDKDTAETENTDPSANVDIDAETETEIESGSDSVAPEVTAVTDEIADHDGSEAITEQAATSTVSESVSEELVNSKSAISDSVDALVQAEDAVLVEVTEAGAESVAGSAEPKQQDKLFTRLKRGLSRTKGNIGSGFKNLFRGKHIDDELFEELEEQLLIADLGVATTSRIIDNLTQQASRKALKDAEALYDILKKDMAEMLHKVDQPLVIDSANKPYVILMVGVNGVGKTTTIGKMAKKFQAEGKSVMLAAGDTFRAAAVEQLQVWGERNDVPVVAQHTGADSASVLFDAMQSATAKNIDVLIADTAGRLQNKNHLMEELKKVLRVMRKHDASAPHEIMLTIDAGTGQNALSQAELFKEAVGLTGITLTKLDGTAKGGVIFAVADKFEIPIRFIGIGEGIDDLRTFNSEEFIDALFTS